ncbi:MAG: hypothetical protein ABS62_05690 [Microbacterium sp. SCN 70-200]|uniref:hypothetical protein n=1 Tax=unclassified Microbacterium TaxID=2609290 RepID=UPI00086F7536|nr:MULTISPECIES: hypothetical protein [unclassified Microbacterium]MBN9213501.1 hypothetical protein [Microbacterium sp.]ODT41677.1 MAG: hypothetical protein ABS62_05690 [Microbacterium sp. SCN 70-200]OJV85131.1 MAG: hypothetical protein BGO46_11165 [Microbacterium sp. 70-16]
MPDTYLVSRTAADDAAFLALADLSQVLDGEEESGIIGGQMVSMLCARFPSPGSVLRRTGDADGGIPRALASTSTAHGRLMALGYAPTNSNRYVRPGADDTTLAVDLLVPNLDTRLRQETLGGRTFDSMPGLGVALAHRLSLEVSVTLSNDEELLFTTTVPSVEGAIMLKAYAWKNRRAMKDAIDLHSLFRIVEAHPTEDIGGWQLDEAPARGVRRDVGQILHSLADGWEAQPPPRIMFDYRQVIASIRTRVARPR